MSSNIPVITIDGVGGCGKGTICQLMAHELGWHLLDSGVLYRVLAWALMQRSLSIETMKELESFVDSLNIRFEPLPEGKGYRLFCEGQEVTEAIRTEECSAMAS